MGAHHNNEVARLAAQAQNGQRVVKVFPLDETHALVPTVLPQIGFDAEAKTISVQLAVHVVKTSSIIGGQSEGAVSIVNICTIPMADVVKRFEEQYGKPPPSDAE
jgi:hypothetical protein